MTKNRMGNLMTVVLQLTEMSILIVNYFFGRCNIMSLFRQLSNSCLMRFACYIIKENALMPS